MERVADDVFQRARARVGQVLRGKWRLDRLLGVGGTACVYAATHRNGKRGAVKLLRPEFATDEEARHRFLREGYVANRIEHPGAVAVLDDDTAEDGTVFLVMELLEGQNLEERGRAFPGGRLHPSEVAFVAERLLDVLAAAHDKGIVHRDLKPENVFLTRTGQVKILDFGIARMRETAAVGGVGRATEVGAVMGTPAFMPPEQALGHTAEIDARTDLWALGAVMFYALSGRLVHEAETVNKVLLLAMTRQAPPIASLVPGLPQAFCEVVDYALAFDRQRRWPDARTMQRALRAAMQLMPPAPPITMGPAESGAVQGPGAARLTGSPFSRDAASPAASRKAVLVGASLAAVLVLGGVGFVLVRVRGTTPTSAATAPASTPAPPPSLAPPASAATSAALAPTPPPSASAAPKTTAGTRVPPVVTTATTTVPTSQPSTKPPQQGGSKDIFSEW
ncbi:serine/threonine-protein kinase [Polyangium sp. y55x31]|uniref:serine/threonine-protein kinase n=1 Tax=Polyangium sp. y55x31 TaxID=3042688 RepID=UPI002482A65D|nr:serine/threonine-protein kinase [Polyangium sp. y55x31]MDI1483394.1 serine/threonine-protein kinase [Polyangium sp. y55x31]